MNIRHNILYGFLFALTTAIVMPAHSLAAIEVGPLVQNITETTAEIRIIGGIFDNEAVTIAYGIDRQNLSLTATSPAGNKHQVALRGLAADTTYYYEVTYGSDVQPVRSFHTAPMPGDPFEVVVLGATKTDTTTAEAVMNEAATSPYLQAGEARLVIHTGDMVSLGLLQTDWNAFMSAGDSLFSRAGLLPSSGAGELGGDQILEDYFPFMIDPQRDKWYSYDYGNLRVIVLHSSDGGNRTQQQFLADQLADAAADGSINHMVVVGSHPIYSSSGWGRNPEFAATVEPLMNQYTANGANIVLSGGYEAYERSVVHDVHYVVVGTSGAPVQGPPSMRPAPSVAGYAGTHYGILSVDGPDISFAAYGSPNGSATPVDQFDVSLGRLIGANVAANDDSFFAGDQVTWETTVYNSEASSVDALTFHLLEIAGQLFFVDYETLALQDATQALWVTETLAPGSSKTETLLSIASPDLGGASLPITWYGAVMDSATGEFGPVSSVTTTHR